MWKYTTLEASYNVERSMERRAEEGREGGGREREVGRERKEREIKWRFSISGDNGPA